tara:strand:+ start:5773 stop:6462 length:690 start_codon:yes stop_codon:yes gene_type:complete
MTQYIINEAPRIKKQTKAPDQRKFSVVPLDAVNRPGITFASLKVLIVLSSYCNKAGSSYVSLDRIGQDLGISRQAVGQSMKRLTRAGLVKEYNNHYKNLKGSTRRIIYDPKISDQDVQAISNAPIERLNNQEIKARQIDNKIMELDRPEKALEIAQSSATDRDVLASLYMCVSTERDLLELEQCIAVHGQRKLLELIDQGQALHDIHINARNDTASPAKGTLPPSPPSL